MEWKRVVAEFGEYVYSGPGIDNVEEEFRKLAEGRNPLEVIELYEIVYGYDDNTANEILSRFQLA